MELAFRVKSPVQASTKTPKLYLEKILVAMDVTIQKIQKMLLITTLCLYLSEEDQDEDEFRRSRTKKLKSLLGEEVLKLVGELISCQKILTNYHSSSKSQPKLKELSAWDAKAELIGRLKGNWEKREFLSNVYKSTKAFLISMANCNGDTVRADNEDIRKTNEEVGSSEILHSSSSSSLSLPSRMPPFVGDETGTQEQSAVKLLRKALESKYKRHVRRCFQELDVESLMNILYLVYEDSTKTGVSPEARSQFLSSVSHDEEYECFDFALGENETDSDMNEYFCDQAEEISSFVIGMDMDHEEDYESFFNIADESNSFMDNHDDDKFKPLGSSLVEEMSSLSLEGEVQLGTANSTNINIVLAPAVVQEKLPLAASKDINIGDQFEMNCKLFQLQTTLLEHPLSSTLEAYIPTSLAGTRQLNKLLDYFSQLRSIAQTILAECNVGMARGGLGNIIYHRSLIDYKLFLIKERKLKSVYIQLLAHREQQRKELEEALLRWTSIVEKAADKASISVKSYVQENLTSEAVQRKISENKASKIRVDLQNVNGSLSETVSFVKSSTKSLRARRHYLEASLDALNRHYGSKMQKYQVKLDELQIVEEANKKATAALQKKFKYVEETYDEMRAMRRLKELLQNMQKAEAIKQNWAARKIQMQWRKYKLAKLRKKKLKGKRKGKKKTPPPQGKGSTTPSKTSTPASRSRSKSQTP